MKYRWMAVLGLALALVACGDGGNDSEKKLDSQLATVIGDQHLTGDPTVGADIPDIEDPLCQLGMKLFFTKALGGDQDAACVSCHHPNLAGGDALSLPVGVGAVEPDLLGPGRDHAPEATGYDGGPPVPRNAPTTFNIAMYKQAIFWDGRIQTVAGGIRTPDSGFGAVDPSAIDLISAQAPFPVTSGEEMRGFVFEAGNSNTAVRDHLAARLAGTGIGEGELEINGWQAEFDAVYGPGAEITYARIAEAIGAYERSQAFVNNPWKSCVGGDKDALNDSAKRGAMLFFNSYEDGGANCASCHKGDFFTDEDFHVMATPQIGRGKKNGPDGDDDFGRFNINGDPNDLYAFRTPALLNVAVGGPYGHAGAYLTLEAMVRHMLNPEAALAAYDYAPLDDFNAPLLVQIEHADANTALALAQLQELRAAGLTHHQSVEFTDGQVADLVAFLESLTDPCVTDRGCLDPWIPGEEDTDPDNLRVNAYDGNGDPL